MKKDYLKKGFLPDQYVVNYIKRQEKSNKFINFILMCGFIILLPISISEIKIPEEEKIDIIVEENNNYNIRDIVESLNFYGEGDEGQFTYSKFEVVTEDYISLINKLDLYKIKDVIQLENGKFKILVERG